MRVEGEFTVGGIKGLLKVSEKEVDNSEVPRFETVMILPPLTVDQLH